MRLKHLSLLSILFILACRKPSDTVLPISFYYWKTNYKLSQSEQMYLTSHHTQHLYIRYFDIDLSENKQAIPISPILYAEKPTKSLEITPVIYIKNKVFLEKEIDTRALAQKVWSFIQQINTKTGLTTNEIQIDCDWSLNSRATYFSFLQALSEVSAQKISATIRLHQVKYYQKTGIPPVYRGVLMYYNMGSIAADTSNSIYSRDIAEKYLPSLQNYQLPLDIALPIYSWAVHSSEDKVVNLISKVQAAAFSADTNFVRISHTRYQAKSATIKKGFYFKQGDIVKIENTTAADRKVMLNDLLQHLKTPPKELIYYDLDAENIGTLAE